MNSLQLLLNSKLIFLKDLLQYLSLSFFLFSLLAFQAKKKSNEINWSDEYFFVHNVI